MASLPYPSYMILKRMHYCYCSFMTCNLNTVTRKYQTSSTVQIMQMIKDKERCESTKDWRRGDSESKCNA